MGMKVARVPPCPWAWGKKKSRRVCVEEVDEKKIKKYIYNENKRTN